MTLRRLLVAVCLAAGIAGVLAAASPAAPAGASLGPVVVINYNADIDQLGQRYLSGALKQAADKHAEVAIIKFNTLGGAINSMLGMVSDILASPVPVVVWIGPPGAGAGSAGTFISAAASFLAMASATTIGAAAPVGSQGQNLSSTEAKKTTNFLVGQMTSIAHDRHRGAAAVQALQETISQAKAYSAEEALTLGIADLRVSTLNGLIANLNGRTLDTSTGAKTVHTAGAPIEQINLTFWQRLLGVLADPNLIVILLSVGGLGLIIELWSYGTTWIPGTLGVICLLSAFAGLSVLPFSWAGLSLILLGIALLGIELHAPGHLFFGISGGTSIIVGGILLLGYYGGPGLPGYHPMVSRWLLFSLGILIALAATLLAREVHLSHHGKRYVSPLETKAIVGALAEVNTRLAPDGEVWVNGEVRHAKLLGGGTAEPGERVRVTAVDGFNVVVEPIKAEEPGRDSAQSS